MKKYTRKKTGGKAKSLKFSKFDVVKVFTNKEKKGDFEKGVLFSEKHRNGTYTVQFENGRQDEAPETHLVFRERLDNLNENDIEKKRKDVIRYTLLYKKTLDMYDEPRDTDGNTKGVPDYEGKIRFSIFSGEPFNEEVANMIACNWVAKDMGECSHFTEQEREALRRGEELSRYIREEVTTHDIDTVYNEEAPQRAAANSPSSSPSSSPPASPEGRGTRRSRGRKKSRGRKRSRGRNRRRGRNRSRGRSRGRNRSRGRSRGRNRRNSRS